VLLRSLRFALFHGWRQILSARLRSKNRTTSDQWPLPLVRTRLVAGPVGRSEEVNAGFGAGEVGESSRVKSEPLRFSGGIGYKSSRLAMKVPFG
jgi:hypothetical protein